MRDPAEAEARIDSAFRGAQRFDRRDLIVNLLNLRAWVVDDLGRRPWESEAIMRGMIAMAERWGLRRDSLRLRVNLLFWLTMAVDPRSIARLA